MATHQEIAGITDEELIERLVASHDNRFGESFWSYFDEQIGTRLPDNPAILDIGCGPGLLLRDLQHRYPGSTLTGTDVTEAVIDYAKEVEYVGQTPSYLQHDATAEPLPAEDGSTNLVVMVAVLHVLDSPLKVLREIHRVLAADGVFVLQDWIRTPLPQYLDQMTESVDVEKKQKAKERLFGLFAAHNKYTVEDWHWLLIEGGMEVLSCEELGMAHFRTFTCIKRADTNT